MSFITNKSFWVDILAMIVFSWVIGMFFELVIGGMTFWESVQIRAIAMIPNALFSGFWGMYREWMVWRFAQDAGRIKTGVVDIFVFATTQVPQYAITAFITGVETDKIIRVTSGLLILSLQVGWLAGLTINQFRRWFGVPPSTLSAS